MMSEKAFLKRTQKFHDVTEKTHDSLLQDVKLITYKWNELRRPLSVIKEDADKSNFVSTSDFDTSYNESLKCMEQLSELLVRTIEHLDDYTDTIKDIMPRQ